MIPRAVLALACLAVAATGLAAPRPGTVGPPGKAAVDTCLDCHRSLDETRLSQPAEQAATDIHRLQGITCAGCHGGDPRAEDPEAAMNPALGFVGAIAPTAVPALCSSCHSDPSFMLRYAPNIPTDQAAQYATSRHGLALAKGDTRVATCTSCHGAHGVLPAEDARSPVYPSRIVATCGRCHADAALMRAYGISGNEVADYQQSVHYAALTQKNDLSAPTCNDCHGSHGATPPGVSSVSNVCGTCHLTQRELFDLSPHKEAFASIEQPACETCHGNHAVHTPDDTWIGVGKGQVCGNCHVADDPGGQVAVQLAARLTGANSAIAATRERVAKAERAGMLMDEALVQLEEAHQALVLARNQVHAAALAPLERETGSVLAAAATANRLAQAAEDEIRFRRTGLAVSLVVILLAVVALLLKTRSLER
jgi:hypothetical protein